MLYTRVRVGDVATIRGGKRLPAGKDFITSATAQPYIRARDIGGGKVEVQAPVFIDEDTARKLFRYTVRAGDVCLTIVGANVGAMGVVPPSLDGANLTENAVKIVSNGRVDQAFLKYAMLSEDAMAQMKVLAGGAAQPKLGIYKVETINFPFPPMPVQQRIADILSTYDELIENCLRRIKILEAIARDLYREWFVHFRFPGHENHPRVASALWEIPEGWEVKPFSALAGYINGYPFKPAQLGDVGKPIIKIKELKAGIIAETPRNPGDGIPEKYEVQDGYILFSWSADLDTYLWKGGEGLLNQHLFNVLPFDGISRAFCFHALKESMPRFRALSLGATMHHIKRSALDQVFTLLPPTVLRIQFDSLVVPMHRQLIMLAKQVDNLRRTRDLLLPRLLSGQIKVEAA